MLLLLNLLIQVPGKEIYDLKMAAFAGFVARTVNEPMLFALQHVRHIYEVGDHVYH